MLGRYIRNDAEWIQGITQAPSNRGNKVSLRYSGDSSLGELHGRRAIPDLTSTSRSGALIIPTASAHQLPDLAAASRHRSYRGTMPRSAFVSQ